MFEFKGTSNNPIFVTPAQAGVQFYHYVMDFRFRGNDIFRGCLKLKNEDVNPYVPVWIKSHGNDNNLAFIRNHERSCRFQ